MFRVEGIDHVAITVSNVSRSVAWYQDVLGLERRHEGVWGDFPAVVGAGATSLALFPAQASGHALPSNSAPVSVRHIAFRVDREMFERARHDLKVRDIATTFEDHTAAHSLYFADPDGHRLEITTYDIPK